MVKMMVASERSETRIWCVVTAVVVLTAVQVASLNGPNVCMVKQKYNITKRVKYRAPMSIRTYEWCFSMPPRCSKWNTEMRDLTRLETEERTAEVAVCCPGYRMKDVSCVPICPHGKTGHGCSEDCPPNKWGPNCVHECPGCDHGTCSQVTGECRCDEGWQGESCSISMPPTPSTTTMMEEILTTAKPTTKTIIQTTTKTTDPTTMTPVTEMVVPSTTQLKVVSSTTKSLTPSSTLRTTVTIMPMTTKIHYNNMSVTTELAIQKNDLLKIPINITINSNYNRTEIPIEISSDAGSKDGNTSTTMNRSKSTIANANISSVNIFSTTPIIPTTPLIKLTVKETVSKTEPPKKPETTAKVLTTKSKPKEIWIRPTQRGESTIIETKIKTNLEQPHNRYRNVSKNEDVSEFTTPRTIIVSIIPTSVSYVTFKKIALTTASYMSQKNNITTPQQQTTNNKTEIVITKKLTTHQMSTAMPFTIKFLSTLLSKNMTTSTTVSPVPYKNITKTVITKLKETSSNTTKHSLASKMTNSMPSTVTAASKELNSSNILTTTSSLTNNRTTQGLKTYGTTSRSFKTTPSNRQTTLGRSASYETATTSPIPTSRSKPLLFTANTIKYSLSEETRNFSVKHEAVTPKLKDVITKTTKLMSIKHWQKTNDTKKNVTKVSNPKPNVITTAGPLEDETFHILTEPEHITAVMNEKGRDHASVDLISVISIAGGVMMAVITVAVIIVMVERCKRPRYDDVRKINDIRMQVMIDNNDVPPPYVRSIFHTPLPDPPTSEKCHYQPISTLDRNLKQFMRPVVVQTISPIMLENFRGILECHYDHLPQRNYDCGTLSTRCSVTPSMACSEELHRERALSVTDYTIETMKCEAKLDVIDNTTSEPLYAEIPCWRPPSEHAIEVLNLNGEAVTEL